MKQKEIDRIKAINTELEVFEINKPLPEKLALLASVNTEEQQIEKFAISLFQSVFRMTEHYLNYSEMKQELNNLRQIVASNKELKRELSAFKNQSDTIQQLRNSNRQLRSQIADIRLAKRDKKEYKKIQQENAILKDDLATYKKSVDSLSAELGKLKRKIQKGRV